MYEYVFFGSKRTIASWSMKFFKLSRLELKLFVGI